MFSKKNLVLLVLFSWTTLFATEKDHKKYIEEYKYIAISEMERTGVPASITLAQGILESNAGKSKLARKAKNHFGIKCGSNWRGKTYYLKDDDYKKGKLVKSCFRVYKDPIDSYQGHSDFLLENQRYQPLFQLDPLNYKKWAKGLKKAGYATSASYDKKLIDLVERYELHRYDRMTSSETVVTKVEVLKDFLVVNDVKMALAEDDDTPFIIAQRHKISVDKILKYNEELHGKNQPLAKGTKVFLQKKRNNFRGKQHTHIVKEGETMYDIAQQYGLKLSKLYRKNKMESGMQPAIDEQIRIRGKAKKRPLLRDNAIIAPPPVLIETQPKVIEEEAPFLELEEEEETLEVIEPETPLLELEEETTEVIEIEAPIIEEVLDIPPPVITSKKYHTVVKGETLWSISKKYGTTVAQIMQWNQLDSKIIPVGLKLRVE